LTPENISARAFEHRAQALRIRARDLDQMVTAAQPRRRAGGLVHRWRRGMSDRRADQAETMIRARVGHAVRSFL
jgi:hypothetical protein